MPKSARADRKLCAAKVWRCTKCKNTVAAGPGNTKPDRCQTKGCPGGRITGSTCRRTAGWGTDHSGEGPCRTHCGNAPQVAAAAKRRLLAAEAEKDLARLGFALETTPIDALEAMLFEAASNVAALRHLVSRLDEHELHGELYHADGTLTGRSLPNVLVVMYDKERDFLAKLAEACAKLGLDERRVRLAEADVERLLAAVTGAMGDIGMAAEQTGQFKQAIARRLRGGT